VRTLTVTDDHLRGPADQVLVPFLEEDDRSVSESLLGELVTNHAEPVIRAVIRRRLMVTLGPSDGDSQNQDALELAGDVRVKLVGELRSLKGEGLDRRIVDFRAYVAVTTYNACHDYLRRRYPRRWQLRNQLRYLLTHRRELALWRGRDREWLCGLASWRERPPVESTRWEELRHAPRAALEAAELDAPRSATGLERVVGAVVRWLGGPITLDQLVEVVADLWQIEEARPVAEAETLHRSLLAPEPAADSQLAERRYLERLWSEICDLPTRQRSALLLNLRDGQGRGVVGLLPILGIASVRQIAAALETPAEQFATQWRTLPWDDATIGDRIGLERQQVVNLRKAARARLSRRMRGW
jgi:hypothetical protein